MVELKQRPPKPIATFAWYGAASSGNSTAWVEIAASTEFRWSTTAHTWNAAISSGGSKNPGGFQYRSLDGVEYSEITLNAGSGHFTLIAWERLGPHK